MAELVMQGVSKVYPGPVAAVQDLDLEIRDQELMVLVGPSGCGKTTTLRLIAGLEDPDRGTIWMDGRQVNRVAPRDRNIAMVFQQSVLYPQMTVYKNMAIGLMWRCGEVGIRRYWRRWRHPVEARQQAERRRAIANQVLEAARILGIEHLLDRLPRQLSGGECQRVALGRAIVRQPAAFLFDEPLSQLDAHLRSELRREVKRLHQRLRGTMVYVTHDQAEALALGDRVVVMDRGRIQQAGTPREVYEQPANVFVAGFLGTPGMNLISGRWQRHAQGLAFESAGSAVSLPPAVAPASGGTADAEIILGIRPEHLWLRGRTLLGSYRERAADRSAQTVGAGRIVLTEFSGSSMLATVRLDDPQARDGSTGSAEADRARRRVELVVMMPPGQVVEVGQDVTVGLDPTWIRFFDVRTGENVSATRSAAASSAGRSMAGGEPHTEN